MVLFWFVIGVGLLLVELTHFAFFALFAAIGCFAAAVVAWVAPDAVIVQGVVAVGVSALGVALVRPLMTKAFHHGTGHGEKLGKGVFGSLVGEVVITLDEVGGVGHVGHVRLAGERWLATSAHGEIIGEHTKVRVVEVDGTTLVVEEVDSDQPRDPEQ